MAVCVATTCWLRLALVFLTRRVSRVTHEKWRGSASSDPKRRIHHYSLVIEFNVMKSVSAGTIIALLAAASSASAFVVPQTTASSIATSLFAERSPELDAAIAEVRECASAFGEETAHFANVWIDKMLEGKQEGMAAGLLDECLIDDDADKCAKYDAALKKLDSLLGVGAGEQF